MRLVLLALTGVFSVATAAAELPVLVYHDIVRGPVTSVYSVSEAAFRKQMTFLKEQGYTPVSLHQYAEAAAGRQSLPPRPVMLTFDDGLRSFLEIALPVLSEHEFPAVLSVTTAWLDGRNVPREYRGRLLTADMLRTVSRAPRVEIISHSDNLHHSIPANPQGGKAVAAITRQYQEGAGSYETEPAYRRRIHDDLLRSASRLQQVTGKRPVGIAWPYGYFNRSVENEAAALGMTVQLTLDERPASLHEYPRIRRTLLRDLRSLGDFEQALRADRLPPPLRLLHITLDELAGRGPEAQRHWLARLIARLELLRINAVLVNPFSQDGEHAYFANPVIPARADVLSWVLQEIRGRAGINHVYLHLPVLAGRAAYAELARRHAYDGVLFQPGDDQAVLLTLHRVFEDQRPGLRCAGLRATPFPDCRDLVVLPQEPGRAESVGGEALPGDRLVLLRNTPDISEADLLASLRTIHARGARHYGFRDSRVLTEPAVLLRVATELARHVPNIRRP